MEHIVKKVVPRSLKEPLKLSKDRVGQYIRQMRFRGIDRYCPACNSSVRAFLPGGIVPRADVKCPVCHCLERHRLMAIFFRDWTKLSSASGHSFLHIAPERIFRSTLGRIKNLRYVTADLCRSNVTVRMDITHIAHSDNSFDYVFCSHVLEHIDDDRKAMAELHRVLKPDGWAILQVPITAEKTYEDPNITDPRERLRLFGQEDHVRRYGPDFLDRLQSSGFQVAVIPDSVVVGEHEMERMGIGERTNIYFCTKEKNNEMLRVTNILANRSARQGPRHRTS